jgi:hypothetical protein
MGFDGKVAWNSEAIGGIWKQKPNKRHANCIMIVKKLECASEAILSSNPILLTLVPFAADCLMSCEIDPSILALIRFCS